MSSIKTFATVIGYTNYRDNDRMLTLLSSDMGKISVLARGCRKPKSPILSASELMATGEFILFENNNRYILISASIEKSFYNISLDAYKFYCASFVLELSLTITQENEDNIKILNLINKTLSLLESESSNKELAIVNRFILMCLKYSGFKPRIVHCCMCGDKISADNNSRLGFDFVDGGVICSNCYTEVNKSISKVVYLEMFKLAQFKNYDYSASSDNVNRAVFSILTQYLESQLQNKLKTSKFLQI